MKNNTRHLIQLAAAALLNGYFRGFVKGTIFQGNSKMVCVPVLNCYSCPGALGACPIGSLQAVLGDRNFSFSFYVLGFLVLFGMLGGRLFCGFLCPFGFIQDLLHKIKLPKLHLPPALDHALRYLKYAVLAGLVVLAPLLLTNSFGMGNPYFCKLLCPVGTLEGGIPLVLSNPALQTAVGSLFLWKIAVLIAIVVLAILIHRPFCKYLCPLGALYGLFNRVSFYQLQVDKQQCNGCGACEQVCEMDVKITTGQQLNECIRCGRCQTACPHQAIQTKFFGGKICLKKSLK